MITDLKDLVRGLRELAKRVRLLEVAVPLENASIDRGGLAVRSNEGLVVEGSAKVVGWLVVTGTARVTGRLEGSGTFDWTGPLNAKGATTITGTLDVTGKTALKGETTVTGDLIVTGTGKLKVGTAITFDPTDAGGSMSFSSGAKIWAGATGGAQIKAGSYDTTLTSSGASIGRVGKALAITEAVGFQMVGLTSQDRTGIASGGLWADANGRVFRAP